MSNYYQSPNNSQPFGPAPQPQQPVIMVAANRNRALGIIMVVLMVLLVAVLGLIGWLYFNRTYQGHAPVLLKNQDEIETTAPANNAAQAVPQAAAPAAPVTVTVPAPAGNGGASNNSDSGSSSYDALTIPATRCSNYAYAGTNGSDFVSVCNDGGYTYKAYVNDGYLERPATAGGSGRFVVDASPHTITVSGAAVFVQDSSGNTVLTVPMTNWR